MQRIKVGDTVQIGCDNAFNGDVYKLMSLVYFLPSKLKMIFGKKGVVTNMCRTRVHNNLNDIYILIYLMLK